jgi:hypothetical protein
MEVVRLHYECICGIHMYIHMHSVGGFSCLDDRLKGGTIGWWNRTFVRTKLYAPSPSLFHVPCDWLTGKPAHLLASVICISLFMSKCMYISPEHVVLKGRFDLLRLHLFLDKNPTYVNRGSTWHYIFFADYQRSMLWSQFSAFFANFQRKIGVFLKIQCYDQKFA